MAIEEYTKMLEPDKELTVANAHSIKNDGPNPVRWSFSKMVDDARNAKFNVGNILKPGDEKIFNGGMQIYLRQLLNKAEKAQLQVRVII